MKIPQTKHFTHRVIPALTAPLVLTLTLAGCASPAPLTTASSPDYPVFIQAASSPLPAAAAQAAPRTQAALAAQGEAVEIPTYGPGLYQLALGPGSGPTAEQKQFLLCMVHEAPGDVAVCSATMPVRWKETTGQHRQASRILIHQEQQGQDLSVRADTEAMAVIRIVPTDITGEAVIAGLHVRVEDNEAYFSTSPEELVGSVLITPDSYEVISESAAERLQSQEETPPATAAGAASTAIPAAAKVKVT